MTKYYYNNELIRTSKTHSNYTHAVLQFKKDGTFRVVACAKSKELAERRMMSEMSNTKHNLKYIEERLRKLQRGYKVQRKVNIKGFPDENTINGCMEYVKYYQDVINNYYATAKVVEIEAR